MSTNSAPGIYAPDNPTLERVIADGQGFRPDYAWLLLHFVGVKAWTGDLDDGYARLNAGILRQWIQPRALGALNDYFAANGVLQRSPHSAGRRATGFRVAERFDGPPRRHQVQYLPLAEKLRAWRAEYRATVDDPVALSVLQRRRPLLEHLRNSLHALSLPATPQEIVRALRGHVDANHVLYVTKSVLHHDYDGLTVDGFGWRVHHLITRTSSHLRPLLLIDGHHAVEVDIANSQPLFLAILLAGGRGGGTPAPTPLPLCCASLTMMCSSTREVRSFQSACESGELYDLLAQDTGLTREQAKKEVFRDVLFGKPHVAGRVTRAFGRRWPSLLDSIRRVKCEHGYKVVAQALQRLESVIVLDRICVHLLRELPGVPFLTIHDSALLAVEAAEAVRDIMTEEFLAWGVRPIIRLSTNMEPGFSAHWSNRT